MPAKIYAPQYQRNVASVPQNTHLVWENSDHTYIYYVDSANNLLLKKIEVSTGTISTVETRTNANIARGFHDWVTNEIYFVDCDYDEGTSYVWKIGLSDDSITELDVHEGNIHDIYVYDSEVFIITDYYRHGIYGGGNTGANSNVIDYIDVTTTTGNATDRGDLTVARNNPGGVSGRDGSHYGFFGGGNDGAESNVIDYINVTHISGNAVDKGDLTVARDTMGSISGSISGSAYGFFGGGEVGIVYQNVIDYIDITTTTGNASDKGDLTVARKGAAGFGGNTYGFFGGGTTGAFSNVIDYINLTTTSGNATDKGDLTVARGNPGGVFGQTYGYYGGGIIVGSSASNVIDYINLTTTTGNASDKGDLTLARWSLIGTSGINMGFFGGGITAGPAVEDEIDYIDITTTSGNATDKGDLTVARGGPGGCS